jgi:hypothetical protein
MKTSILFIILAFIIVAKTNWSKVLIISHSNYNNNNGIACVAYGDVYIPWNGLVLKILFLKKKRWK